MDKLLICLIILCVFLVYKVCAQARAINALQYETFMQRSKIISLEQCSQDVGKPNVKIMVVSQSTFDMTETGNYIIKTYGKNF